MGLLSLPRFSKFFALSSIAFSAVAAAQTDSLTLEEALQMARERNGDVATAYAQARAAKARVGQARSVFFPTVTPQFQWNDQRQDFRTGFQKGSFIDSGSSASVVSTWQILDSGEREYGLLSAERNYDAQRYTALQTLRSTLFNVDQQYFNTLRAQELERVADLQVERAKTILDQTTTQANVGEAPKKDIFQANADYLNAKVEQLTAKNLTVSNSAQLKATIGWDKTDPLPALAKVGEPNSPTEPEPLQTVLERGLKNRADLIAQRYGVKSQEIGVQLAERQAGITFSLDATYQSVFSPDVFQNRQLAFNVSYPLFDGFASREKVREARANLDASKASLVQAERQAKSDIESAYLTLSQNYQRVLASKQAQDAADENYKAAVDAQRLGALGTDVVTVLTAQVSLVTAETNYIQAIYDYYISDAQLRLSTGEAMPGETP